ncbi:LCP family protein [Actinobaculum suis]|uniref:LCP family protein n=1 Tax=Actinobaculum suis TaxID=1657 RepID=UPI001E49403D|nr:LCP family protein [Actinobaculum suis]
MANSNRAPVHLLGKRRGPRIMRIFGLIILALLLAFGSAAGYLWSRVQGNIDSADITKLLPETKENELQDIAAGQPLTFLVLGSDARSGASDVDGSGAAGEVEGMRSDTTMIVHIAADRSRVDVVSIPRDTAVDVPSCTIRKGPDSEETTTTKAMTDVRFNAAFAAGGQTGDVASAAACTMRTLQEETGLRFNGYVVVDFASFITSVDAINGVPMYFEEPMHDEKAGLDIEAGCRLLDGQQALALARARYQIGDGSDISRIGRQQELVMAVANEVLSSNLLADAPQLLRVVDAVSQSVSVSSGLGQISTIAGLANSVRGIDPKNIHFATMPFQHSGNRVVIDKSAKYVWWAINNDVPFEMYEEANEPRAYEPAGYNNGEPLPAGGGYDAAANPATDNSGAGAEAGNPASGPAANSSTPGGHEGGPQPGTSDGTSGAGTDAGAGEAGSGGAGAAEAGQTEPQPSPTTPVCTRENAIPRK